LQKQPGPEAKGNNEKKIREALVIRSSCPERDYDNNMKNKQYTQHINLSVGKYRQEGPEKSDDSKDLQYRANEYAPGVEPVFKPHERRNYPGSSEEKQIEGPRPVQLETVGRVDSGIGGIEPVAGFVQVQYASQPRVAIRIMKAAVENPKMCCE
jgi:hypothetical protein